MVVMISTTRIEGRLADRAGVVTTHVATDAEDAATIATIDGFCGELGLGPSNRSMVNRFFVAFDTSIEYAAAFEPDADNITLGIVVGALRAMI